VKGAFEVMTIEITKEVWGMEVMNSALFLGSIMLVVSMTTLLAYVLEQRVGESRLFFYGLLGATLFLPFYYLPVSQVFATLNWWFGLILYLSVSILMLSFFNIGRTIAFSLTTELPTPQWRDYFLGHGSSLFTMGRGVGPILAGGLSDDRGGWITVTVLVVGCVIAAMMVAWAYFSGRLEHNEHEVGPATAELQAAAEEAVEEMQQRVDRWLHAVGFKGTNDAKTPTASDPEPEPAVMNDLPARDIEAQSDAETVGKNTQWVFN
jgi:hypothetical protein